MFAATLTNLLGPRFRIVLRKPIIENIAFKLHYKATCTLFLTAVILVCMRDYFGETIKCMADNGVPTPIIEKYCFFMATFTIVRHYNESLLQGGFLPHPGVGPMMESDETLHHTYYQWVPFVLFVQSIAFYMPHYIWKQKEGGRIKALVDGLQYASLALIKEDMKVGNMDLPSEETLSKRINIILRDIRLRLRITRTWSVWLVAMEVTNLVHVMFEIWIINVFLNGNFISLGPKILNMSEWGNIADPLETVFPKVTKCIFHKYGPSGSIQQHDALCVMALNIIHEKIYAVLWFWLLFLFIVSVIAVIWRIMSFFLYRRSPRFNMIMFQRATDAKFDPMNVIHIINGCQFADWLFLYYLAKNMQGAVFKELFNRLANELAKKEVAGYEDPNEKKGAAPELSNIVNYHDETLPLQAKS